MRKLRRSVAKYIMKRAGVQHINSMMSGWWRDVLKAPEKNGKKARRRSAR